MAKPPPLNDDYERRPYWWATAPQLPDRTGRDLPDTADAVVIGGGYTGTAAARQLALQAAKTVLLEANTLGWGASSRNGGICHPGFKWGPETLVKRHGRELAHALYAETVRRRTCSRAPSARRGSRRSCGSTATSSWRGRGSTPRTSRATSPPLRKWEPRRASCRATSLRRRSGRSRITAG
jgi:glycine/D-amino acid oxidase-like deaminating enzyme